MRGGESQTTGATRPHFEEGHPVISDSLVQDLRHEVDQLRERTNLRLAEIDRRLKAIEPDLSSHADRLAKLEPVVMDLREEMQELQKEVHALGEQVSRGNAIVLEVQAEVRIGFKDLIERQGNQIAILEKLLAGPPLAAPSPVADPPTS